MLGRLFQFNIGIELYRIRSNYKCNFILKLIVLSLFIVFPYQKYFIYSHLFSTAIVSMYLYLDSESLYNVIINNVSLISYSIYLVHYPLLFIVNNKFYYLLRVYLFSFILTVADRLVYYFMKNKTIYIFITYSLSSLVGIIIVEMFKKINNNYNLIENSGFYYNIPLSSYTCHVHNQKCRSILIIGDSHALPIISMIYIFCKVNSILIYYKFIHTSYLVFDKRKDLYDILLYFSLTILTHHYSKEIHSNSSNLVEKLGNYIAYLKKYAKYVFYIMPTPYLFNTYTCDQQIRKRIAIIDEDIDSNVFTIEILNNIRNLKILNFTHFFCNKKYCNLIFNRTCIYKDRNHISKKFVIFLTSYLINNIKLINFKSEKKCIYFYNNSYILLNNKMNKLWKIPKKKCCIEYIEVPY